MKIEDLKLIAKHEGIKISGTKEDLIKDIILICVDFYDEEVLNLIPKEFITYKMCLKSVKMSTRSSL